MTTEIFEIFFKSLSSSSISLRAGGWLRLFASPAVPGPATLARSAGEKATKAEKNILENSAFSAYRTNHHPRKYKKDICYNNIYCDIKTRKIQVTKNEAFISFLVIR